MKIIRQFFSHYSKEFWIFVMAVILLAAAACSINNSLALVQNNLNQEAADSAADIAQFIKMVESTSALRRDSFDGEDLEAYADEMIDFIHGAYPGAGKLVAGRSIELTEHLMGYSGTEPLRWQRSYDENLRRNYFTLSEPVLQKGRQIARILFYFDERAFLDRFFPELKDNERVTLLAPGNYVLLGDMNVLTEQNKDRQFAFVSLEGNFTLVLLKDFAAERDLANRQILLFSAALIFCVFLIQPNKKWEASPFQLLSETALKTASPSLAAQEKISSRATILLFMSLMVSVAFLMLFRFINGGHPYIFVIYLLILIIVILGFILQSRQLLSGKIIVIITYALLFVPFLLNVLHDDFGEAGLAPVYLWTFLSVIYALYSFNIKRSQLIFKIFSVILFPEIILNAVFAGALTVGIMDFVFHAFLLNFVFIASFEAYTGSFIKEYADLQKERIEITEERKQLESLEKKAEIGLRLAEEAGAADIFLGKAKEAAAGLKNMSWKLPTELLLASRNFGPEDIWIFREIVKLSLRSFEKSEELRGPEGGKEALEKYFDFVQIKNSGEIAELLLSIGICELEKVEENLDFFKRDNITDILRSALILFPGLKGISEVGFE